MKKLKLTDGREVYFAEEVDQEIEKLKRRIAGLKKDMAYMMENNRGGNVANLTPRQPKYSEEIQREIAERVKAGESKNKLSKEFDISRGTVLNYCRKFEGVKSETTDMDEIQKELERVLSDTEPEVIEWDDDIFNQPVKPVKSAFDEVKGGQQTNIMGTSISPNPFVKDGE